MLPGESSRPCQQPRDHVCGFDHCWSCNQFLLGAQVCRSSKLQTATPHMLSGRTASNSRLKYWKPSQCESFREKVNFCFALISIQGSCWLSGLQYKVTQAALQPFSLPKEEWHLQRNLVTAHRMITNDENAGRSDVYEKNRILNLSGAMHLVDYTVWGLQQFAVSQVECILGDWMEWSGCTVPCGGGQQTRVRAIMQEVPWRGRCDNSWWFVPCLMWTLMNTE